MRTFLEETMHLFVLSGRSGWPSPRSWYMSARGEFVIMPAVCVGNLYPVQRLDNRNSQVWGVSVRANFTNDNYRLMKIVINIQYRFFLSPW
jgi:hypothetical protein